MKFQRRLYYNYSGLRVVAVTLMIVGMLIITGFQILFQLSDHFITQSCLSLLFFVNISLCKERNQIKLFMVVLALYCS